MGHQECVKEALKKSAQSHQGYRPRQLLPEKGNGRKPSKEKRQILARKAEENSTKPIHM
jgi:hypothetical protein